MKFYVPLHFDLTDKKLLFVGGGEVNERRILALLDSKAQIVLVSLEATEKLKKLAREGKITWIKRAYKPGDVKGMDFVFVAIPEGYEQVVDEAKEEGVWVECASKHTLGDFIYPAVIRKEDVVISLSTSGRSPKKARLLKKHY